MVPPPDRNKGGQLLWSAWATHVHIQVKDVQRPLSFDHSLATMLSLVSLVKEKFSDGSHVSSSERYV